MEFELVHSILRQLECSISQLKHNNNNINNNNYSKGLLCKILVQDVNKGINYYLPLLLTACHLIK